MHERPHTPATAEPATLPAAMWRTFRETGHAPHFHTHARHAAAGFQAFASCEGALAACVMTGAQAHRAEALRLFRDFALGYPFPQCVNGFKPEQVREFAAEAARLLVEDACRFYNSNPDRPDSYAPEHVLPFRP